MTPDQLADLIIDLLGPAPPGAGNADRRTQQGHYRRQAVRAARASGCTCKPDITFHAVDPHGWGMPSMSIAHDDWCPLVDHGSQMVAFHQAAPHQPRPHRNGPCPCGSGQKFKRCHGRPGMTPHTPAKR